MPLSKNVSLDGRTSDKEQYDHSMQMHPTVFCFAASPLRQKISAVKAPHLYFHLRVFCMVCLIWVDYTLSGRSLVPSALSSADLRSYAIGLGHR